MSAKVKISYTDDTELQALLWLLSPMVSGYKIQPEKGRFRRCYIDIKERFIPPDLVKKKTAEASKNKEK